MDRPDLEMVQAVRQHGSLAQAAQALGLTPSAVTRRVVRWNRRTPSASSSAASRRVTAEGVSPRACAACARLPC